MYSESSFGSLDLPESMRNALANLANHSLASRTWSTYKTVEKHLSKCQHDTGIDLNFPMDTKSILIFTHWLVHNRGLKGATVNTYISGLRQIHLVKGHDIPALRPPILQQILAGKKNLDAVVARETKKPKRLPVTINVMKLLKLEIRKLQDTNTNKALLWSVCTLAFNGCMRIHELLARKETEFDIHTTLLHKDVSISPPKEDGYREIQLKLKSPKEDRVGNGKIIDIYETKGPLCPVRALQRWSRLSKHEEKNLPLFRLENGKNLTGRSFNKMLKLMLGKHLNYQNGSITSHSFRSGLATLMGQLGFPDHQIMAMGRWSSSCFETYLKLPRSRRMEIAKQIGNHIP